jgi:hypothetical protein
VAADLPGWLESCHSRWPPSACFTTPAFRPGGPRRWLAESGEPRGAEPCWSCCWSGGGVRVKWPAWQRGQARMQPLLPEEAWQGLLAILSEVARLTAGA